MQLIEKRKKGKGLYLTPSNRNSQESMIYQNSNRGCIAMWTPAGVHYIPFSEK